MRRAPVVTVVVALVTVLGAAASAQPVGGEFEEFIIDFEDYPATGPGTPATPGITDFYSDIGVTFNGPSVLDYDEGIGIEGFAHSGSKVAEHCYSQEFCSVPVRIEFADPQARVGVWVGYSWTGTGRADPVVLLAYGASGVEVSVDSLFLPPDDTVPVDNYLEVASPSQPISAVELRWDDPEAVTNGLAVDDVVFEPAVASMSLSPEGAIDFGEVELGTALESSFDVVNSGNTTLTIRAVTPSATAGLLVDGSCAGVTLLPGELCPVEVGVAGEVPGVLSGSVAVTSSAGESSITLTASFAEPSVEETTSTRVDTTTTRPETTTTTTPDTTDTDAPSTTQAPVTTAGSGVVVPNDGEDDVAGAGPMLVVLGVVATSGAVVRRIRRRRRLRRWPGQIVTPMPVVFVDAARPTTTLTPDDPSVDVYVRLSSTAQSLRMDEPVTMEGARHGNDG